MDLEEFVSVLDPHVSFSKHKGSQEEWGVSWAYGQGLTMCIVWGEAEFLPLRTGGKTDIQTASQDTVCLVYISQ